MEEIKRVTVFRSIVKFGLAYLLPI